MRALYALAFLLPAASTIVTAQTLPIFHDASVPPAIGVIPDDAGLVTVDSGALSSVDATASSVIIPRFHIPGLGRRDLELQRFDLLTPTAIIVEGRGDGDRPMSIDRHLMLRGRVAGIPGSFVYMAIFPNYASGYIELPSGANPYPRRILVAPDDAAGPHPVTIVFTADDTPPAGRGTHDYCGVDDAGQYVTPEWQRFFAREVGRKETRSPLEEQMLAVQIALECDSLYYVARGRNLSIAANYALAIMGASSAIYQRDIQLMIQIPYVRIWTTSSNPYPGPEDGDLLNQLRAYWNTNMRSIQRSGVMVYSRYRGGLAYVGALCGENGYAMAGPGGNVNYPATGYVWDVDVTSHELGHNLGSPHTHSCSWMPAIDSCWDAEGGCFAARKPRPGWIMSYCHLNAGTRLFFHPRVATLIRGWAERTGCITPQPHPTRIDLASINIIVPANGGSVKANEPLAPAALVRNVGLGTQNGATATFTIVSSDSDEVYRRTMNVPSLAPGASTTLVFPSAAIADTGVYLATIVIDLPSDSSQYNNRLTRPFMVARSPSTATITVSYPNGGETVGAGDSVTIRWTSGGVTEATIDLSTDGGGSWSTIRWNTPADSGSYRWLVPATPTTNALVRVGDRQDAGVNDASNTPFTIALDRDVQPIDFILPSGDDTVAAPIAPRVLVRNNGSRVVTNLPVHLRIEWRPGGLTIYDTTITVASVPAMSTAEVAFPTTGEIPDGPFIMIARTDMPGDRNISNDSIGRASTNRRGLSPPSIVEAEGLCGAAIITYAPSISGSVDGYVLLRGATPASLAPIDTLPPTITTWVDEPLQDQTDYYYALASLKSGARSIPSRVVVGRPACFAAGETMTPPRLVLPHYDARDLRLPVDLIWERLKGAERYHIELAGDPAFRDIVQEWVVRQSAPITPTDVTFNGKWYWRARGINNSHLGPWSDSHPFTTSGSCGRSALHFNGTDAYAVDSLFSWTGGAVTVEFWNYVRADEVTTGTAFSVGRNDDIGNRFQAHAPWSNGRLYWDCGNISDGSGRITVDYTPYLDKWTHVALIYDGDRTRSIYLDGRRVARAGGDTVGPKDLSWLRLGGTGPGSNHRHKGTIDEFRIWRGGRTAEQIRAGMGQRIDPDTEPDLVSYYRMDEGDGTVTDDLAGAGAYLGGGATWTTSDAPINCAPLRHLEGPLLSSPAADTLLAVSSGTWFDWSDVSGADGYEIQVAADPDFNDIRFHVDGVNESHVVRGSLTPDRSWYWRARAIANDGAGAWSETGHFSTAPSCGDMALRIDDTPSIVRVPSFQWRGREVTVEYWVYVDSADVRRSWIFNVGGSDSSYRLSAHGPWNDRALYFDFGNYNGGAGRITVPFGDYLGKWTHVALVSNGRDFKGIYLNGELVAGEAIADRMEARDGGLTIGGGPTVEATKGRVADFRIWNTARDQERIRENMYRRFSGPQSGLVGYWRLDGGDTLAPDISGFGNDGHIANDSQWVAADFPLQPVIPGIIGPARGLKNGSGAYRLSDSMMSIFWSIEGGDVATGQGTGAITLNWGNEETGRIVVTGMTKSGCPVASILDVELRETLSTPTTGTTTLASMSIQPNPTRGPATLRIDLDHPSTVRVDLYDDRGVSIGAVPPRQLNQGRNMILLPTETLPGGPVFCVVHIGNAVATLVVTVVR